MCVATGMLPVDVKLEYTFLSNLMSGQVKNFPDNILHKSLYYIKVVPWYA